MLKSFPVKFDKLFVQRKTCERLLLSLCLILYESLHELIFFQIFAKICQEAKHP